MGAWNIYRPLFDPGAGCGGTNNCDVDDINLSDPNNYGGNISVDPAFVDADNLDYRLANNSPINTREGGMDGSTTGYSLTVDLAGTTRTAVLNGSPTNKGAAGWSIGAYETD